MTWFTFIKPPSSMFVGLSSFVSSFGLSALKDVCALSDFAVGG